MYFTFRIRVPLFLGQFFLWLYCLEQKIRYGRAVRFIPLNNGRFALVNAADYEDLMKYKWRALSPPDYAVRQVARGKFVYMHNQIMGPLSGFVVDHKNHSGLNNTRENLRIATRAQNSYNQKKRAGCTSKYKGVHLDREKGKYRAVIRANGKQLHLGYFASEQEAGRAYDKAAKELHKEFAVLNFP
jgi:hypothetical protein